MKYVLCLCVYQCIHVECHVCFSIFCACSSFFPSLPPAPSLTHTLIHPTLPLHFTLLSSLFSFQTGIPRHREGEIQCVEISPPYWSYASTSWLTHHSSSISSTQYIDTCRHCPHVVEWGSKLRNLCHPTVSFLSLSSFILLLVALFFLFLFFLFEFASLIMPGSHDKAHTHTHTHTQWCFFKTLGYSSCLWFLFVDDCKPLCARRMQFKCLQRNLQWILCADLPTSSHTIFLNTHRLNPAMRFCDSVQKQMADLCASLQRATRLLQTRVNVRTCSPEQQPTKSGCCCAVVVYFDRLPPFQCVCVFIFFFRPLHILSHTHIHTCTLFLHLSLSLSLATGTSTRNQRTTFSIHEYPRWTPSAHFGSRRRFIRSVHLILCHGFGGLWV